MIKLVLNWSHDGEVDASLFQIIHSFLVPLLFVLGFLMLFFNCYFTKLKNLVETTIFTSIVRNFSVYCWTVKLHWRHLWGWWHNVGSIIRTESEFQYCLNLAHSCSAACFQHIYCYLLMTVNCGCMDLLTDCSQTWSCNRSLVALHYCYDMIQHSKLGNFIVTSL